MKKNHKKILRVGLLLIGIGGTGAMMTACADGYTSTSVGLGVSSYDTYRPYSGFRNRRDWDGDGVPNVFDDRPRNPYWH